MKQIPPAPTPPTRPTAVIVYLTPTGVSALDDLAPTFEPLAEHGVRPFAATGRAPHGMRIIDERADFFPHLRALFGFVGPDGWHNLTQKTALVDQLYIAPPCWFPKPFTTPGRRARRDRAPPSQPHDVGPHPPAVFPMVAAAPSKRNWALDMLDVPDIWNEGFTGQGAVIAHLDSGIDPSYSAIPGSAVATFARLNNSFQLIAPPALVDTALQSNPDSYPEGHGTITASIMVGQQYQGCCLGVAPDAQLVSLDIWNSFQTAHVNDPTNALGAQCILAAFNWAIQTSAQFPALRVANASVLSSEGSEAAFQPAIDQVRLAGILPVFAAGNNRISGLACCVGSLGVGSMNKNRTISKFSPTEPDLSQQEDPVVPDLLAPGRDVPTLWEVDTPGEKSANGTSFAAPYISGLASLLFCAKPSATVQEVENAIIGSCDAKELNPKKAGNGLPNAPKALNLLLDPPVL